MSLPAVAHTAELQRVAALPRRVWSATDLAWLASELTSILRTPAGTQTLRLVQALALHDAGTVGGLFGSIGVGEGKTLISFLIATIFANLLRPLLLVPASTIEKTLRDRIRYAQHWRIRNDLRVLSNEMLGLVQNEHELENYRPGFIIIDELHKYRNKSCARTRRVARYLYKYPETPVFGFTGSVMSRGLGDFDQALIWCLKLGAPVPLPLEERYEWAAALDRKVDPMARRRPGALLKFCSAEEIAKYGDSPQAARVAFQRRLVETPGVVATIGEGEKVGAKITVRAVFYDVKPVVDENIHRLRRTMTTPDDWELMTAAEKWSHARQMALGLFYIWNPRPPLDWREARRAWNKYVRETIARGRKLDSEKHVANAIDAGKLPEGVEILARWRALKPTFTPKVEAVWFDDSALDAVARWMKEAPGIVWSTHTLFAERLAKHTGAPYYGAGGFDARGKYIEDADGRSSVIASIQANREGKNMQEAFHRNLVVCPPDDSQWWEQFLGRTHRPGQTRDEVVVDVMIGCRENVRACQNALADAEAVHETTGKLQKLLMADVDLPDEDDIAELDTSTKTDPRGARWAE